MTDLSLFDPVVLEHINYYVTLLEQLTVVGKIERRQFDESIIGAATLFLELKFIHCCSKRGHIEDVVVDSKFRGMNLGKLQVSDGVDRRYRRWMQTLLSLLPVNNILPLDFRYLILFIPRKLPNNIAE
ncbi:unnamed protein product [Trichobilharzia regenti]|nr:unnamed protein product [Trichobilharzia regenti]